MLNQLFIQSGVKFMGIGKKKKPSRVLQIILMKCDEQLRTTHF